MKWYVLMQTKIHCVLKANINMKKVILFILLLFLSMGLAACKEEKPIDNDLNGNLK